MAAVPPLIELIGVSKRYDSPASDGALTILEGVTMTVSPGESLAIVGPSGSGKSTLLHIMGTLDRPSAGQVLLNGTDLGSLDAVHLAALRNREIGFVFQAHYLLPQCTVFENVLVPTLATKNNAPANRTASESPEQRAMRLLRRVGLGERIDHLPGQLSGGERQRVAVVRALINAPRLLLADQPTGSLDEASAAELAALLLELNREEGAALVVVTHSRELSASMSRVLRLKGGRLETQSGNGPGPRRESCLPS